MSHSGSEQVFHIPGVLAEPQLPDLEEELKKWKLGDALLDAEGRASARGAGSAPHHRRGAMAGGGGAVVSSASIDTIRLSTAPDQLLVQSFMALHLPASLREKQLTNFEVRRLMQRSKGKRAYAAVDATAASSSPAMTEDAHDDDNDRLEKQSLFISSPHYHHQLRNNSTMHLPQQEKTPLSSSKTLSVIDEQVLFRKGAELQHMIRDAARDRARQMPLPSRGEQQQQEGTVAAADAKQQGRKDGSGEKSGAHHLTSLEGTNSNLSMTSTKRRTDLELWYHRLGLDPSSAKTTS